ncbi:MAG: FKBP-type peptidyl-prolyl cis-trans isomerase [Patescibacteria group bacterium]
MTRAIKIITLVIAGVAVLSAIYLAVSKKPTDEKVVPEVKKTMENTNQEKVLPGGLKVTDNSFGSGEEAMNGDVVTVNYLGTLANGTKFDSSYDRGQAFSFKLGTSQVIKGWDLGLVGMKVGGKRTLTIPPEMGYGSTGAGGVIPPNATLIFEVELLEVER